MINSQNYPYNHRTQKNIFRMKQLTLKILFSTSLILIGTLGFSQQEYRLGGSAIYNFTTKGIGIGGRAEFPIKRVELLDGLSLVPQVAWFPPFNKNTEFYIGSSVHLGIYSINKWSFYTLANVSYKQWINYQESGDSTAKFSNLAIDGGIGITRKSCVRPFMEVRLNFIGIEPSIRVGFLYTFNCDRRGMVPCPRIPAPPSF